MGVASLILGIISLIFGWIPLLCFVMLILSVIGLIFGIVDIVKKNKAGKQFKDTIVSIVGLIICAISIPVIVFSSIFSMIIAAEVINSKHSTENKYNYETKNDYNWYNKQYEQYHNSISYEI